MNFQNQYKLTGLIPADETLLYNDVYLVILYAARIPPHLAVTVNGKLFTLTVNGPAIDENLSVLLKAIKQKSIETIFIKLQVPALMTNDNLLDEIRKYIKIYPRVDINVATCLTPIKDFCASVYDMDIRNINFLYDLLPKLFEQKVIELCYQFNLNSFDTNFYFEKYSMFDIHEGIRKMQPLKSV